MAEPVTATTTLAAATVGATATSATLLLLLGPTGAELFLIVLGAVIGASAGAIASAVRGWRAAGVLLLAIVIALFTSAFSIPFLEHVHTALISGGVAFFATAPVAHAKQFQLFCTRIGAGLTAFRNGYSARRDSEGGP